jgi:hypothetical protein
MNNPENISPDFEAEVEKILSVPDADQQFVKDLRTRILNDPNRLKKTSQPFYLKLSWAVLMSAFIITGLVIIIIGPKQVWAAVRSLFGYVPGIGFVQSDTPLRVLDTPLSQERDGITIKVEEGLSDSQQTILLYTVDGISQDLRPTSEDAPFCIHGPYLRLENGSQLEMTQGESNGWPSGYQAKEIFQPVPANMDAFTLVIPCVGGTRPGSAPENWEFTLTLKPAPADMEVLPVINLSTLEPTATQETTSSALETNPAAPETTPVSEAIQINLEKMVELENGYLIQGNVTWQGFDDSFVNFDTYQLQLTDANGQNIPIEPVDADRMSDLEQKEVVWAVTTNSKGFASPLTFSLPSISIDHPASSIFDLDLGDDPQTGTVWDLNQDVDVSGYVVHIVKVTFSMGRSGNYALDFSFETDPNEITAVSVSDPDNHSAMFGGGGGGDGSGVINQSIEYDYVPQGVRHFLINRISTLMQGPWTTSFDLPSNGEVPTQAGEQPQACVDAANWEQILNAPSVLPAGLNGRLLVEGPVEQGATFPTLFVSNLDGSSKTRIGPGAWASLSPDGTKVIYVYSDGMHIAEIESGQNSLATWAGTNDYNPLWSPDGTWIAFVRSGEGIYLIHPDGSGLQKLNGTTNNSINLAGWLSDSKNLVISSLGADGSQVQTVNIETGILVNNLIIDNRKGGFAAVSPDGSKLAFSEMVFGQPAYGLFVANLDGSNKSLVGNPGVVFFSASAWSPDSTWLLATAYDQNYQIPKTTSILIQPDTCQVIRLDGVDGIVDAWVGTNLP